MIKRSGLTALNVMKAMNMLLVFIVEVTKSHNFLSRTHYENDGGWRKFQNHFQILVFDNSSLSRTVEDPAAYV